MGLDFYICISSLIIVTVMGVRLAIHNHKVRVERHDEIMAAYRARKKLKNEALRRRLGLAAQELRPPQVHTERFFESSAD